MAVDQPLRIAEITSRVKELLESAFPALTVEGEISNCRPSSTGHLYFTLKDETSAISAVMFKGKSRSLGFVPRDGMLVHATGSLSVYEARGTYQIIVESMQLAGAGDILRILEERKRRLAAEGLFDSGRKRPLPPMPSRVAVVTSPTGAAVRDIVQIIRRRNPGMDVTVLPAAVQGAGAAESIARQIEIANAHRLGDVIIVGRGGGSLEDLLPFSEEAVVRAVAASDIPVVSAVGHEIDWSLCDFAADLRAPTPSAAAELVCPLLSDVSAGISASVSVLATSMAARVERVRLALSQFAPESLELRFRRIEQPLLLRFDDAKEALLDALSGRVRDIRHRVEVLAEKLEGSNPTAILGRGYSVIRDGDTRSIITSAGQTRPGRPIEILLAKGRLSARVEEATQ